MSALAAGGALAVVRRKRKPLPVVLIHGILDNAENMEEAASWVRAALGRGAYVRCLEVGNGEFDSIAKPMSWQLTQIAHQIQSDRRLHDGLNIIGYSQGSLLARGFVQKYGWPKVHSLISWVGPQAGQFGVPDWEPLLKYLNQITSPMWYSALTQQTVSFSNYWRDPMRLELYREKSSFLADLNNELPVKNATYRLRLGSLSHFVLVYSKADTIIQPQESSWFGFFKPNSTTEVVPLRASELYIDDHIGLKALDQSGRLHFAACDCKHQEVPTTKCKLEVWEQATKRFLKPEHALPSLLRWLRPEEETADEAEAPTRARRDIPHANLDRLRQEVTDLKAKLASERARAEGLERMLARGRRQ